MSRAVRLLTFVSILALAAISLVALSRPSEAATTWVVNSTGIDNDAKCEASPGDCTLLDAIFKALPGDYVHFDIPGTDPGCDGSGVCTIRPTFGFILGQDNVTIDGYTQAGASPNTLEQGDNAVLKVVINMDSAPPSTHGIQTSHGGITIRGLVINGLTGSGNGILLSEGSSANVIAGNFFGTDVTGTIDQSSGGRGIRTTSGDNHEIGQPGPGNRNLFAGLDTGIIISGLNGASASGNLVRNNYIGTNAAGTAALPNGKGIEIDIAAAGSFATDNVIGGGSADERNVISGNTTQGVYVITGSAVSDNIVQGNYIGTDATGASAIPNDIGVHVSDVPGTTIRGNVISGNVHQGVLMSGDSNKVLGNFIGTDATGAVDLGNGTTGVDQSAGLNNVIGDGTFAGRNLISGNLTGVAIAGGANSAGTSVRGNLIGTDITGTQDVGNDTDGVFVSTSVTDVTIAANLISGNGSRGIITSSSGSGITIQSNRIGTNFVGASALPNGSHGILMRTPDSVIGGAGVLKNIIGFNGDIGVAVGDSATGVDIQANLIFANTGLGIDLSLDGVTANDAGDGDTGANNHQNFPVLTQAISGSLLVRGSLNSTPSTDFLLRVYVNNACDASGNGEGLFALGSATVTTNGSGNADFAVLTSETIAAGKQITATVTNNSTHDTSEFSNCVAVQPVTTPTPTPIGQTPTPTPVGPTPTPTSSPIPLETDPPTPVPTPTPSPTPTPTVSPAPTPTHTPPPTFSGSEAPTPISQTPSPTPTPTPFGQTPSPTPFGQTPTPTATAGPLVQGNVDCDGDVDSVDGLKELRHVASLDVSQNEPCPDIGTDVASVWGDVDCDGDADAVDGLKVLRSVASLPVSQNEPCPDIGTPEGG